MTEKTVKATQHWYELVQSPIRPGPGTSLPGQLLQDHSEDAPWFSKGNKQGPERHAAVVGREQQGPPPGAGNRRHLPTRQTATAGGQEAAMAAMCIVHRCPSVLLIYT